MESQLVTDLKAARKLIEKPEGWTRRTYARDEADNAVTVDHPRAVSFCMLGACDRVTDNLEMDPQSGAQVILDACVPKPFAHIADFNDDPKTTHEDVLAVFDKAIAAASTNSN